MIDSHHPLSTLLLSHLLDAADKNLVVWRITGETGEAKQGQVERQMERM